MAKKDYQQLATEILEKIGGRENVMSVTHCATRLRFALKDQGLPDTPAVKNIPGVMGVAEAGGQYQIIIGQHVPKVYDAVCSVGHFVKNAPIDENLDGVKRKVTVKSVFSGIINYVSSSVVAAIPVFCAAGLIKAISSLLGPDIFGIISTTDDLYLLMDFMYDACFYFLPVYVAYSASKTIGTSTILSLYIACLYLAPDFVNIAGAGEPFTVFGIPCYLTTYGTSLIPILLSVFCLKYVEKFFDKTVPDVLAVAFKPFLTVLVMTPLALCCFGPLGALIGNGLSAISLMLNNAPFITGLIGGMWTLIIMSGMHAPLLYSVMVPNLMTKGYDDTIFPAIYGGLGSGVAMLLATMLKVRDKNEKVNIGSYLIANLVGGISEPGIYGVGLKYKTPMVAMIIGSVIGGWIMTFSHAVYYMTGAIPVLRGLSGFMIGGTADVIKYTVANIVSFAITFVIIWFSKNEIYNQENTQAA